MSFSNIEVNYSNDIMSLHVMIDLQSPNNAGGIAALNSHGKSLTQEQCWTWFVANFCKPTSNLRDKFHGILPLTPDDSMATGMKLRSFFSSASVAAEPAFLLLAIIIIIIIIIFIRTSII